MHRDGPPPPVSFRPPRFQVSTGFFSSSSDSDGDGYDDVPVAVPDDAAPLLEPYPKNPDRTVAATVLGIICFLLCVAILVGSVYYGFYRR